MDASQCKSTGGLHGLLSLRDASLARRDNSRCVDRPSLIWSDPVNRCKSVGLFLPLLLLFSSFEDRARSSRGRIERRLISLIFAGRNRIIMIRRELPLTVIANPAIRCGVIQGLPETASSVIHNHKLGVPVAWSLAKCVDIQQLSPLLTYGHILPEISFWMINLNRCVISLQAGNLRNTALRLIYIGLDWTPGSLRGNDARSEERRVGKECRSRW